MPETPPANAALSTDMDTPFEDNSTPGLSDEERADEAMEAIFAAAEKQEAEIAEAAAKAAAEAEAAAKAAAEAEAAARGIIDDTIEPEIDASQRMLRLQHHLRSQLAKQMQRRPRHQLNWMQPNSVSTQADLEELAALPVSLASPSPPRAEMTRENEALVCIRFLPCRRYPAVSLR